MDDEEKQHKIAVEDCWRLTLNDIGKRVLGDKNGNFILLNGLSLIFGSYETKDGYLCISFNRNNKAYNQSIALAKSEAVFGTRPYFVCGRCETRCNNLYLRPDGYSFACRQCHNLYYESTRLNRQTLHGDLFYRFNRHLKLMVDKADVKRIDYNGKYTRKAASLMKKMAKLHY